jgi:hypothetical protein
MIQYTLKCDQGHSFDSWFKSSDAFDTLALSGHLICAVCGSSDVGKAVMSPRVSTDKEKSRRPHPVAAKQDQRLVAMAADEELRRAIAELRERVERDSDYVGERFAQEARSMHLGDTPDRSIYGQATADEVRSLLTDGVPILPLPFMPTRKTN